MARVFLPTGYFRDTATVYTEGGSGAWDTVAQNNLACRLETVSRQAAATGFERTDLATIRELHSDPAYEIPRYSQLLIGGKRWNPNPASITLVKHHDGTGIYYRCDLTEAGT